MGEEVGDLQRALELMLSVPHRAQDDKFTSSIEGYRGSIHKLGRLLTHDWFSITSNSASGPVTKERYLFLFKARILICKVRRISDDRSVFQLKEIIRVSSYMLTSISMIYVLSNCYFVVTWSGSLWSYRRRSSLWTSSFFQPSLPAHSNCS